MSDCDVCGAFGQNARHSILLNCVDDPEILIEL